MTHSVILSTGKDELLAAAVKYVKPRKGVYQYVRRVPEDVKRHPAHYARHFGSKPLFRVSLKTKDQAQMHLAAMAVHTDFERRLASIFGRVMPQAPMLLASKHSAPRPVTQAVLDALADRYKKVTVEPFERAYIMADVSPAHAEEYQRMLYNIELDAADAEKTLAARAGQGGGNTPADIAAWIIENEELDAPANSKPFGMVVGAIRAGIQQGRDDIQALIEGKRSPRFIEQRDAPKFTVPTLSEAVEQYLGHRKLPVRTEGEVRSSLRLFEKVVGVKRLDALVRRDFQTYAEYLAKQVVGGKTAGSIVRPASRETVQKRIGLLRSVINHAIDRDMFSGPNPASGIKVDAYVERPNRALMPAKRRLNVDEMNLLFQHPWFTGCASDTNIHAPGEYRLRGQEYWVPVVAALTGCRAGELGGLMLNEVIIGGPTPHLLIRDNKYRRTKGGYQRKVPLLDALLNLGFAQYVDEVRETGAERLFPDWLPPKGKNSDRNDDKAWSNGKIIRGFNRTVIPHMLADKLIPGARQEVTFHSFRGAFKAMLQSSEYGIHPNYINEIIGHAKDELDRRYIGEIPVEDTYPAVKSCQFKGLIIPPSPQISQ